MDSPTLTPLLRRRSRKEAEQDLKVPSLKGLGVDEKKFETVVARWL